MAGKNSFACLIGLSLALIGCKKEAVTNDPTAIQGNLELKKFRFSRFLTTEETENYQENIEGFFERDFDTVRAGTILYGDSLLKEEKGLYFNYITNFIGTNGSTGLLTGGKSWSSTGNETVGIPSFTVSAPPLFPSIISTDISVIPEINRTTSYTVSWNSTISCDSISLTLTTNGKIVSSGNVAGSTSSYTFTPLQLSVLEPSVVNTKRNEEVTHDHLIIEGRILKNETISKGITVRLVNRSVRTTTVIIK